MQDSALVDVVEQVVNGVKDSFNSELFIESFEEDNKEKSFYIKGIFVQSDGESLNKRFYTKDFVMDAIEQINSRSRDIVMWVSHYPSDPLILTVGKIEQAWLDKDGFGHFKARLLNTTTALDVVELIKEGLIKSVSMRYIPVDYEYDEDNERVIVKKGDMLGIDLVDRPGVPPADITDLLLEQVKKIDEKNIKTILSFLNTGTEDLKGAIGMVERKDIINEDFKDEVNPKAEEEKAEEQVEEKSAESKEEPQEQAEEAKDTVEEPQEQAEKAEEPQEQVEEEEKETEFIMVKTALEMTTNKLKAVEGENKKLQESVKELKEKVESLVNDVKSFLDKELEGKRESAIKLFEDFGSETLLNFVKEKVSEVEFKLEGSIVDSMSNFEKALEEVVNKYKEVFEDVRKKALAPVEESTEEAPKEESKDNKEESKENKEEAPEEEKEVLEKGGVIENKNVKKVAEASKVIKESIEIWNRFID